jgi:2-hydroxychromene-2-carboxylate isomerase
MTVNVEFHFDFGSPNAYLAHRVIPAIEARTGVTFRYVPVLLGGVFKATNNVSPAESMRGIRNKGEYAALETRRFLLRHGITDFRRNPHFPVNTLRIMRGAVFAERVGFLDRYVDAVFHHMWCEPKKLDEEDVIRDALAASDLPVEATMSGMDDPAVKQQLIDNTEASVARGAFGSPTFFVDGDMYFGKDTLREVEDLIVERQRA